MPQIQIVEFSKQFNTRHILKSVDKIYEYKMDPVSIVEDAERTFFCQQTDRRADTVKPVCSPKCAACMSVIIYCQKLWRIIP